MRENSMSVRDDLKVTDLGDARQLHALLKLALQLHRALHVGDRDFVDPAFHVHVAGHLLDLRPSLFPG